MKVYGKFIVLLLVGFKEDNSLNTKHKHCKLKQNNKNSSAGDKGQVHSHKYSFHVRAQGLNNMYTKYEHCISKGF